MKRVDLHLHTTHSDGSYAPAELIRYCKLKHLDCVAVTDHDTMSSFGECQEEAHTQGIELVPGVEISAQFAPGTLHVLGYFVSSEHHELKYVLEDVQRARRERNPKIVQKLNEAGIEITLAEVIQETYGQTEIPPGKQLGRPHFANVLVTKGVVRDQEEAFCKYLAKGKSAYVDKRRVRKEEAIRLIHEAGGVASLAHPVQMRLSAEDLEKEVDYLVNCGLQGIEVYSSCHRPEDIKLYLKLAKRFRLVATGGSDFHGANKPDVEIGCMGKGVHLGYEVIEALKSRILKNR
ncbi:MAG: PHP domain-containing protein [Candidatus Omnitrophica bacterium]|nr:PHP domain-containing protein [Candidatus Omnitrophota bacterium]